MRFKPLIIDCTKGVSRTIIMPICDKDCAAFIKQNDHTGDGEKNYVMKFQREEVWKLISLRWKTGVY